MQSKIRTRHTLTLAIAGLAIAVTLGVGAATSGAASTSRQTVTRIHLIEREIQHKDISRTTHGISQGDKIVIASDILNMSRTHIGRADFDCTATGTGRLLGGVCLGVVTLPGGQLTGQFAFGASGESDEQAITGGSGKYEGVHGQFILREGKGAEEFVTIELLG
jgi:hypothetical protein